MGNVVDIHQSNNDSSVYCCRLQEKTVHFTTISVGELINVNLTKKFPRLGEQKVKI